MTLNQFYDWQTGGGTNDVIRLSHRLDCADVEWWVSGGIAVKYWSHPYCMDFLLLSVKEQIDM